MKSLKTSELRYIFIVKIKAFLRAHSVKKTVKGFGLNGCVALIKPHISKLIGKKERRKVSVC